jgi:hypothetical protein
MFWQGFIDRLVSAALSFAVIDHAVFTAHLAIRKPSVLFGHQIEFLASQIRLWLSWDVKTARIVGVNLATQEVAGVVIRPSPHRARLALGKSWLVPFWLQVEKSVAFYFFTGFSFKYAFDDVTDVHALTTDLICASIAQLLERRFRKAGTSDSNRLEAPVLYAVAAVIPTLSKLVVIVAAAPISVLCVGGRVV